jgi:uncharacterized protein affecting Mg2+/Co2+ transport
MGDLRSRMWLDTDGSGRKTGVVGKGFDGQHALVVRGAAAELHDDRDQGQCER